MPERTHSCAIQAPTDLRAARQAAVSLAAARGFVDEQLDVVALLTGEVTTNLVSHAGGGTLLIRTLSQGSQVGLELLTLDRGPGMADIRCCLVDGYSTAGTLGTGLGIICRLSDQFDLYSRPGRGTVLMSRIWREPWDPRDGTCPAGLVQTAPPESLLTLRSRMLTRDPDGKVHTDPPQALPDPWVLLSPSHPKAPSGPRTTRFLVVDSGLVDDTWDVAEYPGVMSHHPSVLAGLLYRDYGSDDGPLVFSVLPA